VGGEVLGWIMIIPAQRPLGEFDSVALEHASTVFGLEFMKQQALFEVEVRWKGDLIDDLLAGKASADLEKRARGLGIILNEPFICMYFDLDRFARYIKDYQLSEGEVQKIKERMYQALSSVVKSFVPAAFISLKSAEFIVFLNIPDFEPKSSLEMAGKIAESFQAWLRRFYPGLSVSVAISGIASTSEAMGVSLLEAQRVLKLYHQARRYGGIFFTEELGVDRLLLQFPSSRELLLFAENILGPVLEHDRTTNNDLVGTLAAYCANNRNFGETARDLHMHQNTVRYRIERINELLGEVMLKPEGWFNIELALRILRLQGTIPAV
jgi:purine catabolism regulator